MLDNLISKLGIQQVKKYLDVVLPWLPSYVTRAIEITSGFSLPILCYTFLPAYRKFCNDPDPDDLKLSKPKGTDKNTEDCSIFGYCTKIVGILAFLIPLTVKGIKNVNS